jgi:hypothetical protein
MEAEALQQFGRAAELPHRWSNVAEFLRSFAGVHFGCVDVALRIHCQIMHPMKLSGIAAVAAKGADDLAGFAP